MARYYLKCKTCCEPWAAELEEPKPSRQQWGPPLRRDPSIYGATCPFCGGKSLTIMGKVHQGSVFGVRYDIPCDGRCTGAVGPDCECSCNGENHGTGMLVAVEVNRGSVSFLASEERRARTHADERRTEFETALSTAKDTIARRYPAYARKHSGEYLCESAYSEYCEAARWFDRLRRVHKLKSHSGRMKAIAQVVARMATAEEVAA